MPFCQQPSLKTSPESHANWEGELGGCAAKVCRRPWLQLSSAEAEDPPLLPCAYCHWQYYWLLKIVFFVNSSRIFHQILWTTTLCMLTTSEKQVFVNSSRVFHHELLQAWMATDGLTGGVQCRTAYAHKDDTWGVQCINARGCKQSSTEPELVNFFFLALLKL